MKGTLLWASVICILFAASAFAALPQTISYQGYVKEGNTPASGPLKMTFSLYSSSPARNNPVWRETQPGVPVANGIYSVQLGSVAKIDAPFDVPYYLGVAIGNDAEMTPVQPISNTGYAFRAGVAETALAIANPQQYLLVQHNGTGGGSVTSTPVGIATPLLALAAFSQGTHVNLIAIPDSYSTFAGWAGACSGTDQCSVTMDSLKNVTAAFVHPLFTLSTAKTGFGTLVSYPTGIYCGIACSSRYDSGSIVTLTPVADSGAAFAEWSGACSGSGACIVTIDSNKTVNARFGYLLTTTLAGGGGGTITSAVAPSGSPGSINCSSNSCSTVFNPGAIVTLTANPAPGGTFIGWSGGCTGTGTCTVTMSQAQSVAAAFTTPLNVSRYNNGGGTISSIPDGILCGSGGACSSSFIYGTQVVLTATPASGAAFSQWSGCDSVDANTCSVSMNAVRNVQAKFTYPLTVARAAASGGSVSGPGLDCGSTCSAVYGYGDMITFVASPTAPATLGTWVGCDSTSGSNCTVAANSARTVTAHFAYPVTITKTGNGGGSITGTGISCGSTCTESYNDGATVSFFPTPQAGFSFANWSGCDSVVGNTCNVTISGARTINATFVAPLSASIAGGADGVLTSSPAGILCGSSGTCSYSYPYGTLVQLTASRYTVSGATFGQWSGCDNSSGITCFALMTTARNIQATYTQSLNIFKSGTGGGNVNGTSDMDCGLVCSRTYNYGSTATLTAIPDSTSTFSGWIDCPTPSGSTCTSTMTQERTIYALFDLVYYSLTATTNAYGYGTGTMSIASLPANGNKECGAGCSNSYLKSSQLTITATPDPGSFVASWTGCDSYSGDYCYVSMNSNRSVMVEYDVF